MSLFQFIHAVVTSGSISAALEVVRAFGSHATAVDGAQALLTTFLYI